MTSDELSSLIVRNLTHPPTYQQRALIEALARFCLPPTPHNGVFLLNGYAGTGKTSVMAALVKALRSLRRQVMLLAPTGRAAKVLSTMAGYQAFTIHRIIYRPDASGLYYNAPAENPLTDGIFIVDEASMITSGGDGDNTSLLSDLVQYVYGSQGDCRMILLGDTAQLPPVGSERSEAMSVNTLKGMGLRVTRAILTQTVRQPSASGILYNATALRTALSAAVRTAALNPRPENDDEPAESPLPPPTLYVNDFDDVALTNSDDLADDLAASYHRYGIDRTILITRSNKRAMLFNLAIRNQILEKESVLTREEPLMVAKNNYHWASKVAKGEFTANGDIITVNEIYGFENRGYLRFADVNVTLPDKNLTFDCKIILSSLTTETPSLTPEQEQMLLDLTLRTFDPDVAADPRRRARALKADPYYNALRVKYAYAITCHKAQGSQWDSVMVDTADIASQAATSIEFYRWLYTAITRATTRLTLIAPTLSVR